MDQPSCRFCLAYDGRNMTIIIWCVKTKEGAEERGAMKGFERAWKGFRSA
jgi:hypothetical protein